MFPYLKQILLVVVVSSIIGLVGAVGIVSCSKEPLNTVLDMVSEAVEDGAVVE
jgi:hypothetical protein